MNPRISVLGILVAIAAGGCGTDTPTDAIPPSGVVDLSVDAVLDTAVVLTWTAPGDDERHGTAARYDIRHSTVPLDEGNWNAATPVGGPPPGDAGTTQTYRANELERRTSYHFALRTIDEGGNISPLSNSVSVTTGDSPMRFDGVWGGPGEGAGQFQFPRGLALDEDARLLVADERNNRVQRFARNGSVQRVVGVLGMEAGQFRAPFGVAVDAEGGFYVTDQDNYRVQAFSEAGLFRTKWGEYGSGAGQFMGVADIDVLEDGTVCVADSSLLTLQFFSQDGVYMTTWNAPDVLGWQPVGVHADGSGGIYVTDTANHRVLKMDGNGTVARVWGGFGSAPGRFNEPVDVTTGPRGHVFVADHRNSRIQVFDEAGNLDFVLGAGGFADSLFVRPTGIAMGSGEVLFVADTGNSRIQRFIYIEGLPLTP